MASAVARIAEFVNRVPRVEFEREWTLQNALIRELEILGEAASKVSVEFVNAHPELPWKGMTGLRHKLIHDYFEVDLDVVWRTATVNVPEVAEFLRSGVDRKDW
ncbi:MAG: HepT-like ribonuclease domain-containing protein [Gemmatimonadota bacterium]